MAKFLTTRGTTSQIEDIINNAKKRLVLISPYVKIPGTLFQSLKDADSRKVKITLVYGKKELDPDVISQLRQLDNLSLCFLENLHAKCFFNEECMVITSLNLYEFSEQNNREMGILVSVAEDKDVFEDAYKEAQLIIHLSTKYDWRRPRSNHYHSRTKQKGYCVRCGAVIPYDLEKPFCHGCFLKWDEWGDPYYEEHYCHTCGKTAPTSRAKPECHSCYGKSV